MSESMLSTLLICSLIVIGIGVVWKLMPMVRDFLASQLQLTNFLPSPPSQDAWPDKTVEDAEFSKFLVGFQGKPETTDGNATATAAAQDAAGVKPVSLEEFYANTPAHVGALQTLCDKASRVTSKATQRQLLCDIVSQLQPLKARANMPELHPFWQVAGAVEGLIKQLTDRVSNITPSTLRTLSSGVDLLHELCVPQVKSDFVTNPPIRILAVDDDSVTRFALAAAIKKAFDKPDLAENGEGALKLAKEHAYDTIFLDVRMPGMDGFELCTKIRETEKNAKTPVVFVTSLSDFESWAQSTVSGGNDLIAKPFLSFEITLKVLSFVLRSRLKVLGLGGKPAPPPVDAVAWPAPALPDSASFVDRVLKKEQGSGAALVSTAPLPANIPTAPAQAAAKPVAPSTQESKTLVLRTALARLAEMRTQFDSVANAADEAAKRETLVTLYLHALWLAHKLDVPELKPAFELCSSLEALLKKLHQNPTNAQHSTLHTVSAALDLLKDLCSNEIPADMTNTPPVRILVVDDDPIGRRAIVGALQTAFFRPDSAEGGEVALMLAEQKSFDVVFLDVQMPGMDGFAVCRKIRETSTNHATPVVFVTSNAGDKWRDEAAKAGGNDYVVKPFPFIEITVKALTFVLKSRLEKLKAAK